MYICIIIPHHVEESLRVAPLPLFYARARHLSSVRYPKLDADLRPVQAHANVTIQIILREQSERQKFRGKLMKIRGNNRLTVMAKNFLALSTKVSSSGGGRSKGKHDAGMQSPCCKCMYVCMFVCMCITQIYSSTVVSACACVFMVCVYVCIYRRYTSALS